MHSNQVLMIAVLIILSLAFAFKGRIFEEIELLKQTEAIQLSESMPASYYYPLTQEEKVNIIRNYIEKMDAIQKRISKSILAKFFIDYHETIKEFQNQISIMRHSAGTDNDFVSFSTRKNHSIIANQEFTREALLNLAFLIDQTFHNEQGNALFILSREDDHLVLNILPYDQPDFFKKRDLQEFASRVSEEAFNGEIIIIVQTDA